MNSSRNLAGLSLAVLMVILSFCTGPALAGKCSKGNWFEEVAARASKCTNPDDHDDELQRNSSRISSCEDLEKMVRKAKLPSTKSGLLDSHLDKVASVESMVRLCDGIKGSGAGVLRDRIFLKGSCKAKGLADLTLLLKNCSDSYSRERLVKGCSKKLKNADELISAAGHIKGGSGGDDWKGCHDRALLEGPGTSAAVKQAS